MKILAPLQISVDGNVAYRHKAKHKPPAKTSPPAAGVVISPRREAFVDTTEPGSGMARISVGFDPIRPSHLSGGSACPPMQHP